MSAEFKFHVLMSVNCAFCGETRVQEYPISAGSEVPRPILPECWRVLDGFPICPRHLIIILDAPPGTEESYPEVWGSFRERMADLAEALSGLKIKEKA